MNLFKAVLGEDGEGEANEEVKGAPSEDEDRGEQARSLVVVLDSTWLMDASSWRLLVQLKGALNRIAIILILRTRETGGDDDFVLASSAADTFAEEQLADEPEVTVRLGHSSA